MLNPTHKSNNLKNINNDSLNTLTNLHKDLKSLQQYSDINTKQIQKIVPLFNQNNKHINSTDIKFIPINNSTNKLGLKDIKTEKIYKGTLTPDLNSPINMMSNKQAPIKQFKQSKQTKQTKQIKQIKQSKLSNQFKQTKQSKQINDDNFDSDNITSTDINNVKYKNNLNNKVNSKISSDLTSANLTNLKLNLSDLSPIQQKENKIRSKLLTRYILYKKNFPEEVKLVFGSKQLTKLKNEDLNILLMMVDKYISIQNSDHSKKTTIASVLIALENIMK